MTINQDFGWTMTSKLWIWTLTARPCYLPTLWREPYIIYSNFFCFVGLGCSTVMSPEAAALMAAQILSLNEHVIWSKLRATQLNTWTGLKYADKKVRDQAVSAKALNGHWLESFIKKGPNLHNILYEVQNEVVSCLYNSRFCCMWFKLNSLFNCNVIIWNHLNSWISIIVVWKNITFSWRHKWVVVHAYLVRTYIW